MKKRKYTMSEKAKQQRQQAGRSSSATKKAALTQNREKRWEHITDKKRKVFGHMLAQARKGQTYRYKTLMPDEVSRTNAANRKKGWGKKRKPNQ